MKKELLKVYQSRVFQIWIDIVRILLLVFMGVIIYILIKEIEAVKLLAYDPCLICMNRTGCNCFCFNN
ncbi:hypothetical protein ES702_01262 [subsurface metagenome]